MGDRGVKGCVGGLCMSVLFSFGFVFGDLLPGYREGLNVSETKTCPTNETEWRTASDRMKCNAKKEPPDNHYYCLPNQDKSKLVEFCYDKYSLKTEKGNCWQLGGQGYLNQVNCSRFVSGCPNETYLSEEIYNYQDCLQLNVIDRCYVAERNCTPKDSKITTVSSTVVPLISTTEDVVSMENISTTSKPLGTEGEGDKTNIVAIIVPVGFVFIVGMVVAVILCRKYRRCGHCKEHSDEEERMPLNKRNETDLPNKIVLLLRQSEDDSFTITTTLPLNISPNTDVKWMKNGKNISRKDEKYACNTGEVLQLKLQSFDVHDEGRYWCVLSTNSLRVESNHISIKYDKFFHQHCLKNALVCCMLLQSGYQVRLHEDVSIRDSFKTLDIFKIREVPSQETLKELALREAGVFSVDNDVINFVSNEEQTEAIQRYCSWAGFINIFIRHASLENVKGYCQQHMKKTEMEIVIERLGYDFLIHCPLHDKSLFALISQQLKIPREVLQMGKNDRHNFVRDLKTGGVQVFHGQGTVVGWARAGKTTLIKKLQGESNLTTIQTKSIEIHPNVFKVDVDGENLEIPLAPEMMGPALNISINCLKSENDLRESRKNHLIRDLGTKAIDENSENSPEGKESDSHVEKAAKETTNILPRQNTKTVSVIPPKLVIESSNEGESSRTGHPFKDDEQMNQELKLEKVPLTIKDKHLKIVTILDFGGQSAYYACHFVYFSPRAFHILVIDMSKDLHSRAEDACETPGLIYSEWKYLDYIRYWITSIHMFSSSEAPVIMVASHTEHISREEEKQKMNQLYEKVINALPDVLRKHLHRERVFAVAKSSKKNLDNIKKSIVRILKEQDHWGRAIPTSWLRLETVLRTARDRNKVIITSLLWENIKSEASIGIISKGDLLSALKFFHEIGIVLFLKNEFVILDVQWFIDAFQCIIDPECPARYDNRCEKWTDFNRTGLLEEELLLSMWRTEKTYIDHQAQILYHMKRLGMLAEIGNKRWYIPFINKQNFEETNELQECEVSSTLCFVFEFFPVVVFYHLISFCINSLGWKIWIKSGSECVYHTAIILEHVSNPSHKILIRYFDESTSKICGKIWQYSIEVNVLVLKNNLINAKLATEVRVDVQGFLEKAASEATQYRLNFHTGCRCRKEIGIESSIILEEKFCYSARNPECSNCKGGAHIINFQETYLFWNTRKKEVHIYRRTADAGTEVFEYSLLERSKQLKVIRIEDVDEIHHIACNSMQKIWISDVDNCLLQISCDGNVLQNTGKKDTYTTGITVNREGFLLFTDDKELALFKVVDGMQIKLRETGEWVPRSVHSSRYTGNIFIGLTRKLENEEEAKVIRCNETGEQVLQEIQWNDGKPLYRWPHHIAENEAGDIYVSDYHLRSLIVVSKFGKFQMDMKVEDFWPHGVTVDRLGNVLVCNASFKSPCVLVFNQDGTLLTRILTREEKIRNVRQICIDDEDRLYLLQKNASEIKVFQYLKPLEAD